MTNSNLYSSFTSADVSHNESSSSTQILTTEDVKSKFKLAVLDDINNKKPHQVKELADGIQKLLNKKIDRYNVVSHGIDKLHMAKWWSKFGFAKEIVSGDTYTATNFVSCEVCFATFRYGSSSTEAISHHRCNVSSSVKLIDGENQHVLDKHFIKKKTAFRSSEQKKVTKLFSIWVSESLRPISIIEDQGLKEICAHFYNLGEQNSGRHMDLDSLFQSRQTLSRCIAKEAQWCREQLIEIIKEPIQSQSVTVSPDMWCDHYRQISYLGVTVTFVDINLKFRKFTMSCRNFPVDLAKTGENVSKILTEELKKYGIENFDSVCWVSDRGSNFIRCFNLNMVVPIFCFAHRMHNVLTITFLNKKDDGYFNDESIEDIPDNLGQDEFLGDAFVTLSIKRICLTINYTKILIKYVKLTNVNELIVKLGGDGTKTLKQSVVTRWLSLFTCIESVYSNYDAIILALESRRATKYINDLTKYNLIDVLLLLAPLNAALQAIQMDEMPSIHLVIPFYQKLMNDYSSFSKLFTSAKKRYPDIFQTSFVCDYLVNEPHGM
ncbi:unnamed protein product [Rotaria sp. Silwood2]|nr:unnamed protein product [Rotaria sp. Silwood2]CAF4357967.1 unnamed protein product [Rotaria sp. Silwood2]